jgi:excisionase family DNA binding protein
MRLRDTDPYEQLADAIRAMVEDVVAQALGPMRAAPTGPVMIPVPEAATRLGIGVTKVKELIAAGRLASVLVGRRRLVPVAALDDFVKSQNTA